MRQLQTSASAFVFTALLLVAACGGDKPVDPDPDPDPVPPLPPTNVYLLPGPDTDDILVNWTTVSGASRFNVYRGEAPGVTLATGTLIGDTPVSPGRDADRPAGTYYYIVTAIRDGLESAPSPEASIVFVPGFGVTLNGFNPVGAGGTQLEVTMTIVSTLELASATVQVADRSASLAFTGPSGEGGGWRAVLDLTGVTHGPLELALALSDVGGHAIETTIPFIYNTAPKLDLVAPVNYAVARPDLHVTATCTDDSGSCASFSIHWVDDTKQPVQEIFIGTQSTVDMDVSLAALPCCGDPLIRFLVTDATGLADTVFRRVVNESPEAVALQAAATVPGRVLDADADRILYLDSTATDTQSVKIRDRATGTDVTLGGGFRMLRGPASLTPTGALFIQVAAALPAPETLIEWRNGVATDLGQAQDLQVSAPYASFTAGTFPSLTLTRLNTLTGATTAIATDAASSGSDVASTGDVAYQTNDGDIWLFDESVGTGQISPAATFNVEPVTDGTNVIYARRISVTPSGETWELERYDGATTTVLAPARENTSTVPGLEYAVNNGWVAFTKAGTGGVLQVWTRSPAGEERQVTMLGTTSLVAALGPDGQVVSSSGRYRLHLPPYTDTPIDLGTVTPTAFAFTAGGLLKLVGNTVFTVAP